MSIKKPNVEQHSNKTWLYDYHFKKWRGNVLVILPLVFCVLFVYRCLSFLFWQRCCLSFDLRLLVSTNFFCHSSVSSHLLLLPRMTSTHTILKTRYISHRLLFLWSNTNKSNTTLWSVLNGR